MDAEGFYPRSQIEYGKAEYLFGVKIVNEWSRTSTPFYAHDVPNDYLKLYLRVAAFDSIHACAKELILLVT